MISHPKKVVVKPSPEDLENSIDFLQNMGFPRNQCESALHYAEYKINVAADLLCTGQIPDEIENKAFNEKFEFIYQLLEERNITPDVITQVVTRFNNEDKKAIRNLIELGVHEDKAILTYIVYDKNEAAATNVLITMLE